MPPFEEGAFIDHVSDTHSLVYNKYSVVPRHCVLFTKQFEQQTGPLTKYDFEAAVRVMLSMNAFVFFNGGFEAGASIMHKHLQAIPLESMNVPIVKAVENHLLTDD